MKSRQVINYSKTFLRTFRSILNRRPHLSRSPISGRAGEVSQINNPPLNDKKWNCVIANSPIINCAEKGDNKDCRNDSYDGIEHGE